MLEATAFQTLDVLIAMQKDSGVMPKVLKVDGGMTANGAPMQFQADLLGVPVVATEVCGDDGAGGGGGGGEGGSGRGTFVPRLSEPDVTWTPGMGGE